MNLIEQTQYEAFLLNAPPETVYQQLKQHYDAETNTTPILTPKYCHAELAQSLLARKDNLISVAVVSFCPEYKLLADLFKKHKNYRALILANKFCYGGWRNDFLKENAKEVFSDMALAAIAVSNPAFPPEPMAEFIEKKSPYDSLTFDDWGQLLLLALKNPVVAAKDTSGFRDDGHGWYMANLPNRALTQALLNIPQNETYLIEAVLEAMEELDGLAVSKEEMAIHKLEYEYSRLPVLQKILKHWEGAETQPKYHTRDIRTSLVSKLSSSDIDSIKWVRKSGDDKLIVGLYAFEDIKPADVKALYKKYGKDFLLEVVKNKKWYRYQRGKPNAVAVALQKVLSDHQYTEEEEYINYRTIWKNIGAELSKKGPPYFNPAEIDWWDDLSQLDDDIANNTSPTERIQELISAAQSLANTNPALAKFNEKLVRYLIPLIDAALNKKQAAIEANIRKVGRSLFWGFVTLAVIIWLTK